MCPLHDSAGPAPLSIYGSLQKQNGGNKCLLIGSLLFSCLSSLLGAGVHKVSRSLSVPRTGVVETCCSENVECRGDGRGIDAVAQHMCRSTKAWYHTLAMSVFQQLSVLFVRWVGLDPPLRQSHSKSTSKAFHRSYHMSSCYQCAGIGDLATRKLRCFGKA